MINYRVTNVSGMDLHFNILTPSGWVEDVLEHNETVVGLNANAYDILRSYESSGWIVIDPYDTCHIVKVDWVKEGF